MDDIWSCIKQLHIICYQKLLVELILVRCRKEGNVLFNNALNTFYLLLYGVRHMVKDHSDSKRGNPLPPHRLLFPITSKGSFICIIPDRIIHTTAFVTPVVEHWLERKIAQWVHPMKDRSDDPSHHERTLLPWSYISLPLVSCKSSTQTRFMCINIHALNRTCSKCSKTKTKSLVVYMIYKLMHTQWIHSQVCSFGQFSIQYCPQHLTY